MKQETASGEEADNALVVKQALHLLEDAVEGVQLPSGGTSAGNGFGQGKGVTKVGEFVYALFEHAGITFDTVKVWCVDDWRTAQ